MGRGAGDKRQATPRRNPGLLFGPRQAVQRKEPPVKVEKVEKQLSDGKTRVEWRRATDGALHRDSGPAVEYPDGSFEWWQDGQPHRDGKPAVVLTDDFNERWTELDYLAWPRAEIYYRNGKLHREDGPAYVIPHLAEEYYRDGKLHREDGPASAWDYEDGEPSRRWALDGQLHREDGPALVVNEEIEAWCSHGKLHREDGPAIVVPEGKTLHAKELEEADLASIEGPAELYFLDGKQLSESEWQTLDRS